MELIDLQRIAPVLQSFAFNRNPPSGGLHLALRHIGNRFSLRVEPRRVPRLFLPQWQKTVPKTIFECPSKIYSCQPGENML